MSSDGWVQYAEFARRLDAVRAEEAARTAAMRAGAAEMTTNADDLQARLNGQGGMITNLASVLRFRRPKLVPIPPVLPPEQKVVPATGLADVEQVIERGDTAARAAAERGEYPAFLPTLSAPVRSLLIYGIAALCVLGLQALAFSRTGTETNPIIVLFVLPLIGFGIGYVLLRLGSRTRVAQVPPNLYVRGGFLLCFLVGPIAAAAIVLLSFQSG